MPTHRWWSRSTRGKATLKPVDALLAAADPVAPIPSDADGAPVFEAPWEAQAFAMTLVLYERGLFTWTEWASTLATEIKHAQASGDPDDGSTYYRHWLAAIERLVVDKGVATSSHLDARRAAWDRAAHATPHGQPILLDNDPSSDR
jgi:nitrile hydratase accessory protein